MRRRPLAALALAAALVVAGAACGTDDGGVGDPSGSAGRGAGAGASTSSSPAAPPTSAGGGGGGGGGGEAGPATTAPRPRAAGGGATTTAPAGQDDAGVPATAPAPGSGDVQPSAVDDGSLGPPGAFARTLLRARPATAVVIERAAQAGASLDERAVDRSAGVVAEVTGKPVDVRAVVGLGTDDRDWTADEVRRAADGAATVPQGSGRAVLRLLVLRGTFEGSADVLGVAVRGDVLAVFTDNVAGAATPLVGRAAIADAVLLHELGHLLGLVDLARDTGRADPEHPGHSRNASSVMYWAVESSLVGQVLNGPPPRDLDAEDLADLRALRDGA